MARVIEILSFGYLMNIDKLIQAAETIDRGFGFGSLMNIDKLILSKSNKSTVNSFGSLMNIDKLIQALLLNLSRHVLVL